MCLEWTLFGSLLKLLTLDFQLSLPVGPAESELDLDFYQFSITLIEKKNNKQILRKSAC